ncbi:hypothetical protein EZY14_010085 [Kordia sp. TARA_039_SRF]|nr:hypothetical protein EZY14_010085 [Kordia sp. TARA_039_SRF]
MNSEKRNNDNHSNTVRSLIEEINTAPDKLHPDYTPAVHELVNYVNEAIKAVLPLLNSDNIWERYRAQRVVEGVISRRFGWKAGQGYPKDADGEQQFLALWEANGNYNAEASEEERLASIQKWKDWLTENSKNGNK